MSLKRRLDRLWDAARPAPEEDRRRERELVREAAEHANRCSDSGPLFEITEGGDVRSAVDGKPVTTWSQASAEVGYRMHMGWEALSLGGGFEPMLTLDETDAFLTTDGRFALSRERQDLRALMGPETMRQEEAATPERWERFLAADEEAAEILERLLELAEGADVPEDYVSPLEGERTREEVDAFEGTMKPIALFEDAEERERVRRLTWVLMHDPEARGLLSELTRRRDAGIAALEAEEEGEGA